MASNHEILKTAKWLLRNYIRLRIHFMCWNYMKMYYWCNLSPTEVFWSQPQDRDELVLIVGEKGNKNKEVGSNLWRWSSLSPLFATGDVSSEAKANFIKTWGDGVVFASQWSLYYIIIDYISVSEGRTRWSIYSSAGAHTKTQHAGWVKSDSVYMIQPRWRTLLGQGVRVGSNGSESVCFL